LKRNYIWEYANKKTLNTTGIGHRLNTSTCCSSFDYVVAHMYRIFLQNAAITTLSFRDFNAPRQARCYLLYILRKTYVTASQQMLNVSTAFSKTHICPKCCYKSVYFCLIWLCRTHFKVLYKKQQTISMF
jgi:hypothetical protein